MDFLNSNTLKGMPSCGSCSTGFAPQLSATYGVNDNGNAVFPTLYQDFAGTPTPTGWTLSQSTPAAITQNNGITINQASTLTAAGYLYNGISFSTTSTPSAQNVIAEWYAKSSSPVYTDGPVLVGTLYPSSPSLEPDGAGWALTGEVNPTGIVDYDGGALGALIPSGGVFHVLSIYQSNPGVPGSNLFWYDYGAGGSIGSYGDTPQALGLALTTGYSITTTITIDWARVRAYPPNGAMPASSVGVLT
jgi:hypothetical protein